jgi:hypothetical protein
MVSISWIGEGEDVLVVEFRERFDSKMRYFVRE